MKKEKIEIHLRYSGSDVDDGSMSIEDIIPVLQGFSSAYRKIASIHDSSSQHRIRITGVKPGSADIVLEIWKLLGDNVDSITSSSAVSAGGAFIISKIMSTIKLKKHVMKKPFQENISAKNCIIISNSDNVSIEVPLDVYEIFKSGLLDYDMNKMISPLEEGRIDTARITATINKDDTLEEVISVNQRPYFDTEEIISTITKESWLVLKLNSLTKSTKCGYAYLGDGSRVFYQYTGDDVAKLVECFSYSGPLKALCVAHMDENLNVSKIDISDIERTQNDLFKSDS